MKLKLMIMFLVMCAKLTITSAVTNQKIQIKKPHAVKIESSYKLLTDRAEIILPRNTSDFDKQNVRDVFRLGDKVEIQLGYNGNLNTEFTGYITDVSADIPVKLKLEDEMWKLKKTSVNISQRNTTLENLLRSILPPEYELDALEGVNLGTVRYANTTVASVLERIKQEYGLYSYMKGNILVCGKIYADDDDTVSYNLGKNVISATSLKYQRADDIKLKVKAVSTTKDGEKLKVEVGDPQGEPRQLAYYDIQSEQELERLALIDLDRFKVDGYKGSIEAFGTPYAQHGMKAQIESPDYPERNGLYYIDTVTTNFDSTPRFHRTIQLGQRV